MQKEKNTTDQNSLLKSVDVIEANIKSAEEEDYSPIDIKPIRNEVIIQVHLEQQKTKLSNGLELFLSVQTKAKFGYATIVAVGDGLYNQVDGGLIPMETKVGDQVLYTLNAGDGFAYDSKEYIVLPEDKIKAILPKKQ